VATSACSGGVLRHAAAVDIVSDLAGFAKPSANIALAAILIAGGGLIAAKDMVWRKKE